MCGHEKQYKMRKSICLGQSGVSTLTQKDITYFPNYKCKNLRLKSYFTVLRQMIAKK